MRALSLCVFCGAARRVPPAHLDLAQRFGRLAARRGHRLLYGAGATGLMGALAEGARAEGGAVIGVRPADLFSEVAREDLSEIVLTADMTERKTRLLAEADAVIGLPGGIGTLDEWFEALTLRSLGRFAGPVALLDADDFFRPLLDWLARLRDQGYVRPGVLESVRVSADPEELLRLLETDCRA
jgi:uncharacterized protein (TIGR00730 family)